MSANSSDKTDDKGFKGSNDKAPSAGYMQAKPKFEDKKSPDPDDDYDLRSELVDVEDI